MSETVVTRQFGHARVSVIQTARCYHTPRFPEGREWITHDTVLDGRGMAAISVNSLTIELPGGTVVIDPSSYGPDDTTLGGGSILVPGPSLDVSLHEIGVDPAEVKYVVITHGHDDHYVGVLAGDQLRFPNAEHFFPQEDWDDLLSGEMYNADVGRRCLGSAEADGKLRLVAGDLELGDGVSLLRTPGETRGHQAVRLDAGDQRLYYLGDLFHLPIEFQKLRWAISPRSESVYDDFERSRLHVLEEASAKPSTFVFTHGTFPAWGVAERGAASTWTWRYL